MVFSTTWPHAKPILKPASLDWSRCCLLRTIILEFCLDDQHVCWLPKYFLTSTGPSQIKKESNFFLWRQLLLRLVSVFFVYIVWFPLYAQRRAGFGMSFLKANPSSVPVRLTSLQTIPLQIKSPDCDSVELQSAVLCVLSVFGSKKYDWFRKIFYLNHWWWAI